MSVVFQTNFQLLFSYVCCGAQYTCEAYIIKLHLALFFCTGVLHLHFRRRKKWKIKILPTLFLDIVFKGFYNNGKRNAE